MDEKMKPRSDSCISLLSSSGIFFCFPDFSYSLQIFLVVNSFFTSCVRWDPQFLPQISKDGDLNPGFLHFMEYFRPGLSGWQWHNSCWCRSGRNSEFLLRLKDGIVLNPCILRGFLSAQHPESEDLLDLGTAGIKRDLENRLFWWGYRNINLLIIEIIEILIYWAWNKRGILGVGGWMGRDELGFSGQNPRVPNRRDVTGSVQEWGPFLELSWGDIWESWIELSQKYPRNIAGICVPGSGLV